MVATKLDAPRGSVNVRFQSTKPQAKSAPPGSRRAPEWMLAMQRLEGAYSGNTLRGYRADFRLFDAWCAESGHTALPALPMTIVRYLDEMAPHAANATLKRRIAAIRKVHRIARRPDPTDDEDVLLALRRARRGRPSRQDQALGVTKALRDQLIAGCGTDLIGLRNRAMIAVGYDTLCRRSELVALRVEDFDERPGGGANVLVRRAKTDQEGNGRTAALSRTGFATLKAWLEAARIGATGPVFRPIYRDCVIDRAMHSGIVGRVLKSAATRAGMDQSLVTDISGHSMRVGCAQDLNASGHDMLTIMRGRMEVGGGRCPLR